MFKSVEIGFRGHSIRYAIMGVLAGGVIGYVLRDNSKLQESSVHPVPVQSAPETGAITGTTDNSWSANLVAARCFDENPLDYVDVSQCRALIFRATGRSVAITNQEVDAQCVEWQDKKRLQKANEIAEGITTKFCISNEEDVDAIRSAVQKGYTVVDEGLTQGNSVWIKTNEKESKTEVITLRSSAQCGSAHIRGLLGSKDYISAIQEIKTDEIGSTLARFGAKEELGDWFMRLEKTRGAILGTEDAKERSRIACDYLLARENTWYTILRNSASGKGSKMAQQLSETTTFKILDGSVDLFKLSLRGLITSEEDRERCRIWNQPE